MHEDLQHDTARTEDPLTARAVGAVVRRAGYPTGYRYTQTGYRTHDGQDIGKVGCEVTRLKNSRYGGREDQGHVSVYVIAPNSAEPRPEHIDAVAAALAEAFPGRTITKHLSYVNVSDTVSARVETASVETYEVEFRTTVRASSPEDAARMLADLIRGKDDQPEVARVVVTSPNGRDVYVHDLSEFPEPVAARAIAIAPEAGRANVDLSGATVLAAAGIAPRKVRDNPQA